MGQMQQQQGASNGYLNQMPNQNDPNNYGLPAGMGNNNLYQ